MKKSKLVFTVKPEFEDFPTLKGIFFKCYLDNIYKGSSCAGSEAYHQFKVDGYDFSTFCLEFKEGLPSYVTETRYPNNKVGCAGKEYKHKIKVI